jgi:hypothetical protein
LRPLRSCRALWRRRHSNRLGLLGADHCY